MIFDIFKKKIIFWILNEIINIFKEHFVKHNLEDFVNMCYNQKYLKGLLKYSKDV